MSRLWNCETAIFYTATVVVGVSFWWFMDWTVYQFHSGGRHPIFVLPLSVQFGVSLAVGIGAAFLGRVAVRRQASQGEKACDNQCH